MSYAQLDFTSNQIKRVNLIGGPEVGIIPSLIERHPDNFVDLEGRTDIPQDTFVWYYDTSADRFLTGTELPPPSSPALPPQPTNADLAQQVSDLEASLIIAGVIG